MDDTRITADEIEAALAGDIRRLAEEMAEALNSAKAGRIIADSEEPVRDAHGEFRQKAYEKIVSLLQQKQEAFSPSADGTSQQGRQAGDAPDDQRANQD